MSEAGPDPAAPVGRAQEFAHGAAALDAVADGRFHALAISGEPGIGKTKLLRGLAAMAAGRGLRVLSGRATEFERDLPFEVYAEALRGLGPVPADDPALWQPLHIINNTAAGRPTTGPGRHRLHRDIAALLADRAATGPTVLLLDDLHWADHASIELTGYLLRRPPEAGLMVAFSHRPTGRLSSIGDAMRRLGDAGVSLRLSRLTEPDVAALTPGIGNRRRRLLYQVSRGNPLYLEVLGQVSDDTLLRLTGDGADEPEQALLDVLGAELEVLKPELRTVAQAVAVAGDDAALDLVAHIADTDQPSTASAVDQLAQLGTLTAAGPRLRFRHPLVRAAAYWTSGAGWRTRAHARAVDYLRRCGGPPAQLAHHLERCAQYGDEDAATVMTRTALDCLHTAPATAERLLAAAARVLPDRPELAARRMELLLARARALAFSGDLTASQRLVQDIMAVPGDVRPAAIAFSSVTSRLLGQFDEARALLRAELDAAPRSGRVRARLHAELAAVETMRGEPSAAGRAATQAVTLLEPHRDPALSAAAHTLLALSLLQRGALAAAGRSAERASALLDGAADAELRPHLELIAPLVWVQTQLDQHDSAGRHLARGVDMANRDGLSHALPHLRIAEAGRQRRRGRLDAAVTAIEDALEASRYLHSPETAAAAHGQLLVPLLAREGPETAVPLADRVARDQLPRSRWWAEHTRLALATVYLAAGRPPACLDQLTLPHWQEASTPGDTQPYAQALLATALARTGRLAEAHRHADAALRFAAEGGLPHQRGTAADAYARVAAAEHRWTTVEEHATVAADAFAAAGAPFDEGLSRELIADACAALRRRGQRLVEWERAEALYRDCGADWFRERLGSARRPDRRDPASPTPALTRRERQIAELVSHGLTNREVAGQLHVSEKTVEAHLAHVFTKLAVHSRVGLTRRLIAGPASD